MAPSAYDGTVFFGSHDEKVRCAFVGGLSKSTNVAGLQQELRRVPGTVWWEVPLDGAVYASPVLARVLPRSSSSSKVKDGGGVDELLLVATTKGTVFSFSLATKDHALSMQPTASPPRLLWRYKAGAPLFATPAVDAHLGVAVVAAVSGAVAGVDLTDGSARWIVLSARAVFSSPALGWIPTLLPDGGHAGGAEAVAERSLSELSSTPPSSGAANALGVFVVGGHDGSITCRETASGRRRWTTNLADLLGSTAPLLGPPLGSSGGPDEAASTTMASAAQGDSDASAGSDPIFATPFAFSVQTASSATTWSDKGAPAFVAVCSQSGLFAVLDFDSGKPVASCRLPGQVFSSPVVLPSILRGTDGTPAHSQHVAFVGCRDDHLYALDLSLPRR
jgi:outer membrane protein assembly factor BamB